MLISSVRREIAWEFGPWDARRFMRVKPRMLIGLQSIGQVIIV
jgi:hypothetical protein